jgi:hypothetical protein
MSNKRRFKVQGSRFKVQGSRFKVQGSRFKFQRIEMKKPPGRHKTSRGLRLVFFGTFSS